MQQKRILLEDSFGTFQVDRKRIVTESSATGRAITRIPGRFSLCDTINGNNRRYGRGVWEKNLADGSILKEAIKRNAAFGLLEHPADGHVDLNSPIAIITTKADLKENEDNGQGKKVTAVDGEITIVGTPEGQRLVALIEAGWDPTVSSRGFGSLNKGADGVDEVQEDYVCEGWDVVLKPSFVQAVCSPNRDNGQQVRTESITIAGTPRTPSPVPAPQQSLRESTPPQQTPAPTTSRTMINDIRARLAALKGIDVSKLTPKTYAEGINEMQQLHESAATYLVENARASWQVTQLHDEIRAVEEAWSGAMSRPTKQAIALQENKSKLLQVTHHVVKMVGEMRKKLGEKAAQAINLQDLLEKTIARGKFWKTRSERMEARQALANKRLDFSCRGLERIAERYKTDMTAIGKRLITVEMQLSERPAWTDIKAVLEKQTDIKASLPLIEALFKPHAAASEITAMLEAAKKPKDIIAIREKLTPVATPTPSPAAPVTEGQQPAAVTASAPAAAPAPLNESAPGAPAGAKTPVAAVSDGKSAACRTVAEHATIISNSQYATGPQSISESVAVAQRLSRGAAVR